MNNYQPNDEQAFSFVSPKLNNYSDLAIGVAFQQLMGFMQDSEPVHEVQEDNWALNLQRLRDVEQRLSYILERKIQVDMVKISKDRDDDSLTQLVFLILMAILKTPKSQELISPMLELPQVQQLQIATVMNQVMSESEVKLSGNQSNDEEVFKKLEELEDQKKELEGRLKNQQRDFEFEKVQMSQRLELMQRQEENLTEQLKKRDDELTELYEKFSVSSLQELGMYISGKEQDIAHLYQNIKDMSDQMKMMKENSDDIIIQLRRDLDLNQRKAAQMKSLERKIEQLNQESLDQMQRIHDEHERDKKGLRNQIEDWNNKHQQQNEKITKYKSQAKEDKGRIANLEYDLQKSRAEQTALTRQITQKEQELYNLQNEITDLENALDQMRQENQLSQSILENNTITEAERTATIAGILSPKRNLGYELSQVMNRSFHWEQNDGWKNTFKNDSRINTMDRVEDHHENILNQDSQDVLGKSEDFEKLDKHRKNTSQFLEQINEINAKSVEESEEENLAMLVEFWKHKCETLLHEVNEKESKYIVMKENADHLEAKLNKFFTEQIKYETELQQAKELLQKHFKETENKDEVVSQLKKENSSFMDERTNLIERITLLEQLKNEHISKISQFEQHAIDAKRRREERIQKKKASSIQILEKQLKITKRSYEETLEQKNEEIQLVLSLLADIVSDDSQQQKALSEKIQSNFNMPFMMVPPK